MKKSSDLEWINCVLQDIVSFLITNDMAGSAEVVAAAAASVMLDLEECGHSAPECRFKEKVSSPSNIVSFAVRSRFRA